MGFQGTSRQFRPFSLILVCALLVASAAFLTISAAALQNATTGAESTLMVTSTADSGPGSLRQALLDAITGDTITFDPAIFPPGGPITIALGTALPSLTQGNLTIDASNAGVILSGGSIPAGYDRAFSIESDGNVIRGLQIRDFPYDSILIIDANDNIIGGDRSAGTGPLGQGNLLSLNGGHGIQICGDSANNSVLGNYIGTDPTGSLAWPNVYSGVALQCSPGPHDNTIGGLVNTTRNLISGNGEDGILIRDGAHDNTISGNLVGTDGQGTAALGNGAWGVRVVGGSHHNTLGGATPGERNIISANTWEGVQIADSGTMSNTIRGNYIGTDASGTVALGNGYSGVAVQRASYTIIGGDAPGEGNLISGNTNQGVLLQYAGTEHNTIAGNLIGTDIYGTAALGNANQGIRIVDGPSFNTVGASTGSLSNLVSGNGSGIVISNASHNAIVGNYVGTDVTGSVALPNHGPGVSIFDAAYLNTVGGSSAGERNVLSGNLSEGVLIYGNDTISNTISGNYIGTNAAGTVAIGNAGGGVDLHTSAYNRIGGVNATPGGPCTGECNLISGNSGDNGISVFDAGASHNTISGNYIGTDATGTAPIPNSGSGILIRTEAQHNTVGGSTPGERNVITYNDGTGISIWDVGAVDNVIQNNWIGIDADSTEGLELRDLDVAGDGTVFLADLGRGIFRSIDSAASWQVVNDGLTTLGIEGLAVSPDYATDQRLWAWAGSSLFGSDDGGDTWNLLDGSLPGDIRAVAVSPNYAADQMLLAAFASEGMYRSTNGGVTWEQASDIHYLAYSYAIAFSPAFALDQVVLAVTEAGVYRSGDGGETWAQSNTGLAYSAAVDLAFAPDGQTVLLVRSSCGGERVYRSDDAGQSWTPATGVDGSCGPARQARIAVSPAFASDGTAYVLLDQMFRSLDGGYTWNSFEAGFYGSRGRGLAFSPGFAADGTAYAANWAGVFRTAEAAGPWLWAGANLADRGNGSSGLSISAPTQVLDNVIGANAGTGLSVSALEAAGTIIDGNLIGLAPDGFTRAPNGWANIGVDAPYVTITHNTVSAGSNAGLWSYSVAHHLTIEGNCFGTDLSGMFAVGNSEEALRLDSSWDTVRDNLISGNWGGGISARGSNSVFTGNLIGVDATGSQAIADHGGYWTKGFVVWADQNTIGGPSPADRNIISGNSGTGLEVYGDQNTIVGNYIGTDFFGTQAIPNAEGVALVYSEYNVVGGDAPGERNIISANSSSGISVINARFSTIAGNYIGADAGGYDTLGNGGDGVVVYYDSTDNLIGGVNASPGTGCSGACNLIAGNGRLGIRLTGSSTLRNRIAQNSIHANGELGIDLVDGANAELPAPTITDYDLAAGTATGTACPDCTVELFSDEEDEGRWFEASTVADGSGAWNIEKGSALNGPALTAAATDAAGNTSEFGQFASTWLNLRVDLQGRADDSGALFTAWTGGQDAGSCISGQDGPCAIPVASGTYSVTVEMASYLDSTWDSVSINEGESVTMPTVVLPGGDTNDDCVVNIQDLSFMGYRFNACIGDPLYDLRGDLNADGCINILDLSMAGGNFNVACPVPW